MNVDRLRFYDLPRHWTKRVEPHLDDPRLNEILLADFGKYTEQWLRRPFGPGQYPRDFEPFEKHNHLPPRSREPRYWRYAKWAACHYMGNFNLRLAMLAEADRPWRIVTNNYHTTVWDGEQTVFEFQFLALGESVAEVFSRPDENIYTLPVGATGICTKRNGLSAYNQREKSWRMLKAA
jgi:hypothetical protein